MEQKKWVDENQEKKKWQAKCFPIFWFLFFSFFL